MLRRGEQYSYAAGEATPPTDGPRAKLQQEGSHNPHMDIPGAPSLGNNRDCASEPPKIPTTQGHHTKA